MSLAFSRTRMAARVWEAGTAQARRAARLRVEMASALGGRERENERERRG